MKRVVLAVDGGKNNETEMTKIIIVRNIITGNWTILQPKSPPGPTSTLNTL